MPRGPRNSMIAWRNVRNRTLFFFRLLRIFLCFLCILHVLFFLQRRLLSVNKSISIPSRLLIQDSTCIPTGAVIGQPDCFCFDCLSCLSEISYEYIVFYVFDVFHPSYFQIVPWVPSIVSGLVEDTFPKLS